MSLGNWPGVGINLAGVLPYGFDMGITLTRLKVFVLPESMAFKYGDFDQWVRPEKMVGKID